MLVPVEVDMFVLSLPPVDLDVLAPEVFVELLFVLPPCCVVVLEELLPPWEEVLL